MHKRDRFTNPVLATRSPAQAPPPTKTEDNTMFTRTLLANLLSRSLTVSMCILFAVLAAAFLTSAHAATHQSASAPPPAIAGPD
jgi:hypothetical protein